MKLRNIIDWIWQLPQNICGLVFRTVKSHNIITEADNEVASTLGAKVYLLKDKIGVTLGKYIFISYYDSNKEETIKHECGHVKQSKLLGPLYLIIIGIPSALHTIFNGYTRCCRRHKDGYYHFFTEKWANKLME